MHAAERGQATVELVALLPILALIALAVGQAAVAGWAEWTAAAAARVSARAEALGQDPAVAARRELPAMLRRGARISVGGGSTGRGRAAIGADPATGAATQDAGAGHRATVRLRVPVVVPGLRLGTVSGSSEVPSQEDA